MKRLSYIFIIFIIILLILFSFSRARNYSRNVFFLTTASIGNSLSQAGFHFEHAFSFISSISSLRSENDRLIKEISGLEVDRSKIAELEHENQLLKTELGFLETNNSKELVPAKIVGREPVSFLDNVIIDRGRKDGLQTDMAVISCGALVGQVSEVYDNRARVTLITSKSSIIQAMLQQSRSKGVLKGGISGLVLENITQDANYIKDEYVITSGLGEELPEGILIGKADQTRSLSSSIFKSITVEPIADMSNLEVVFVVKK